MMRKGRVTSRPAGDEAPLRLASANNGASVPVSHDNLRSWHSRTKKQIFSEWNQLMY